jgi:outer membrane receptor protein involved in Fe transport
MLRPAAAGRATVRRDPFIRRIDDYVSAFMDRASGGVLMRTALQRIGAAVLALTLLPAFAAAQSATGNIEGVVTDQSGAVIPGATVLVRNMDTNLTRELTTDEQGRYRATALQPGSYEVTVTLAGFEGTPVTNVQVLVGQTQPVDVKMRPAGVAEDVTVTGETPIIDTRRTDVSHVVNEQEIANLPINGRRWDNFVLLGPAVTNDGNFGLVSYRGISGLYNNNTVDGADNNQAFFSEARGRTRVSYTISQAAIREFQVGISNFSAEFGRAAGGTVNAVTKSGANQMRGEAFYFLRDDKFQAREPTIPRDLAKPDERRQQFGVSAGGPIRQDRMFYFVNFDQQLRDFPYFVRPSTATFFESACTAPGCDATRAFFNSLAGFFPREGDNKILLGKVDMALTSKTNLSLQYNMHRWDSPSGVQTQSVITVAESANGRDIVKTDFGLATLNTVLSQRWLNEARVQIGRDFEAQEPNAPGPSTTVSGGMSFGMANFLPRPKYPDEKRFQFIDNVTWYTGAHTVKVGADINYVRETLINLFSGGGVYSYNNLNAIASDCPIGASGCTPLLTGATSDRRRYSTFSQAFDLRSGAEPGGIFFTTTDYNAFIQDTWRLNDRLTLNLGLRYEYQQLPQPPSGNPAIPATMRFNQDKNNWGPRAGFTYDVDGSHETVIRAGWGVYFGRTSNSQVASAITDNAVTFATFNFTPTSAGAPQYPNVFSAPPTGTGAVPSIRYLVPDLQRPQIYMSEVSVDRLIGRRLTVSASYLNSQGRHLPTFPDTNLPAPTATVEYFLDGVSKGTFPFYRGFRPDRTIGNALAMADIVESSYHALVLQAKRRFANGLLFNANYTLSKSEDTGQNSQTFFPQFSTMYDPQNIELEKGPSSFDRRHRLVTSFHYAPGFLYGIQIGGTGTFESGLPLTAAIQGGVSTASSPTSTATTNGSGASNRAPFDRRNGFRRDGRKTFDVRLSKRFDLGDRRQLHVLWEAFNVFNFVNYTVFSTTKYRVASNTFDAAANKVTMNLNEVLNAQGESDFGRPITASNTLFGPRDMQLGVKFIW